jgi:phage terminase small subunit
MTKKPTTKTKQTVTTTNAGHIGHIEHTTHRLNDTIETEKPLTKAEETFIRELNKEAVTVEDAFMLAYPIAKRWKIATVKAKANRLLSSIKRPKKEKEVIKSKEQDNRPAIQEQQEEDKKEEDEPYASQKQEIDFRFTDEQRELYNACTALQRKVVLNMVTSKMSQRKAYYAAGGTAKTDNAADVSVSTMLSNSKVKSLYDSLMEQEIGRAIMTRDEARLILSDIANTKLSDIADFKKVQVGTSEKGDAIYQTAWELKDSDDMSDIAAGSIEEISTSACGFKFKKHSRTQAIKQLAEMDGWNAASKHELTGKEGKPIKSITLDMSPEEAARLYKESLNKK